MNRFLVGIAFISILVCCCFLTSCQPVKLLMIDSDGIVTYNRHTGQFEMLWEHHSIQRDSVASEPK